MKRNKIMFVIAIVAMLAVLFVACDDKGTQPEHTHTYGAWNIATQPTENAAGTATRACACGETETTSVAKLSDATVWTVTVSQDATHDTAGFKAYKSDAFGTVTLTFPKGEHVYGAWEISKEPTKENTGVAIRKCACGHFEEATLAVLTNTSVWTLEVEGATHETTGKEIYTSEYGVVTIVTEVQQHVYGAWADNHDGTHTRTCACGDTQTVDCVYDQEVAAPDFLKSAATCTAKAVYYKSCVCGAKGTDTFESGTANGHNYVGFQVTQEPTCTETGKVTAHCSVSGCGADYEGEIPALGHDFSGECIPYVATISYGDDDEGGTSYDGSEYHVHTCTRCDAVDSAHKEAHVFGEATYTLVSPVAGWHSVKKNTVCEDCGFKNVEDAFDENYVESDFFTKGEEKAADYNEKGYVEYTYKSTGETFRIYTDKLVAPYEGTTYYYLEIRKTENSNEVRVDGYTSVKVAFDENGNATGDTGLFRGENNIRIIDATTGEIAFTRNDTGTVYNDNGGINLVNGVIVRSTYGDWNRAALMVPATMTVGAQDVSGSFWTDSMAFTFNAKCDLDEVHSFNVFVYDERVYFGVQFVDFDDNAIAAKDCANAAYVQVLDAQGNKIQAFAQKNGTLKSTDGKEGVYVYDGGNVVLNGVGGAVVNGTEAGLYVAAAEGAGYDYDVYIGESVESATAYYRLTLGESNDCTLVKPMATLSFRTNVDGNEVADVSANINVTVTLPTPANREGYVFGGWQLDGAGDAVTVFKATEESNDYRFEAVWNKCSTIVANDLLDADKDNYNGVYVAVGSAYTSVLPAYTENTFRNGYKFAGWYLDNGDGVLDVKEDQPLDDTVLVEEFDAQFVIFASWEWAGNVEFAEQSKYSWEYIAEINTWRSTNAGKGSTSSVMEVKWTSGVVRIEFDYWVESENGFDYLTIYYYDVNGTRQSVITKGSNIAKGNAVHVVCILDGEGESLRLSYSKDGSGDTGEDRAFVENFTINGVSMVAQASLNKDAGVYTAEGAESINVGAGGVVTIGENSYAYSNVSANTIGVMVGDVYREYTLDVAAKTYTVVEPKVNVSYNYNGHGENSTVEVGKYSNQTLASAPTADGFIFRGWYTDEDLTNEASATFVASSDVTFYAKWDEAITLTYVYLDGTTANVVVDLYANDKVETLQAVDFKFGDKVFVGWYTKDGTDSGDWGTEFVANTTLTANTTVYAKWVALHALMGDYTYGANLDPSESGIVKETDALSKSNYSLYVDAEGNVTGGVTGVIKDYNPENGTFYVDSNGSKYYGGYNADTKTIYVDYRPGQTSAFHDIKFAAAQIGDEVPTATFNNAWDNGCTKLVRITYKNGEVESYRYVFIKDRVINAVTSWSAKDTAGADVVFDEIYSNASVLSIVCGTTTYDFGRKNSNFSALDGYQGEYTSSDVTITLDGNGGITLPGNVAGTYTAAEEGADYTFVVKTSDKAYKLTVDKDSKTVLGLTTYNVNVTFENNLKAVEDLSAYFGIATTLPSGDEVNVEGYVFRGWYDNAEFTGSVKTTVTLTADATYYAKYDAAVTVTFDYDGYEYEAGKTTLDVTGKYVNDTLGTLPTVAASVRHNGKAFAGWYFKDGEVWGEQATSSVKLTESVTIYARWIDPPASMGTYKAIEVYSAASGKERTSFSDSDILTINADGSYSGIKVNAGKLSADDAEKSNGVINLGKYAYLSDALGGIIVYSFYYGADYATSIGTDFYIGFRNAANITKVEYSADSIGGGYVAFFTVSYTEDGTAKTMNLFVYNETIYANVMWTNGVTAKAAATAESVLISDSKGKAIVKKSGNAMLGNDGKAGTYTSENAYGNIVVDGFGTLTVNGESVAYTLDGNNVTFVADNAMRVITLGNGTYTKTLDGYQGTYTLPDESTIMLDGYGNVTGTTNTYVVSGGMVTIYEGETSSSYGIDVEDKTLNDKSQFAGLTFSGTYNDSWDEGADKVSIKFDDTSALTGTFTHHGGGYSPAVSAKFTATFDGTNMIVTITECSESSWVGKTFELAYANDTFTITSFFKSSGQYAVSKNTKLSLQA